MDADNQHEVSMNIKKGCEYIVAGALKHMAHKPLTPAMLSAEMATDSEASLAFLCEQLAAQRLIALLPDNRYFITAKGELTLCKLNQHMQMSI